MASSEYFGFNSTQERTLRNLGLGTDGVVGTNQIAAGAVTSAKIADGTINNGDISGSAAIALTKLANVAAGSNGLAAASITANLQTLFTAVANLNAWATALATKLNADAGVTDTNYDTNPQA